MWVSYFHQHCSFNKPKISLTLYFPLSSTRFHYVDKVSHHFSSSSFKTCCQSHINYVLIITSNIKNISSRHLKIANAVHLYIFSFRTALWNCNGVIPRFRFNSGIISRQNHRCSYLLSYMEHAQSLWTIEMTVITLLCCIQILNQVQNMVRTWKISYTATKRTGLQNSNIRLKNAASCKVISLYWSDWLYLQQYWDYNTNTYQQSHFAVDGYLHN